MNHVINLSFIPFKVGMFIVFVVVNGVLGAVILVSHCSCDNLVRKPSYLFTLKVLLNF